MGTNHELVIHHRLTRQWMTGFQRAPDLRIAPPLHQLSLKQSRPEREEPALP